MAKFQLNFWCVTGVLAEDPVRAPNISKTCIHFKLILRNPYLDEEIYRRWAYCPSIDLYARGQQGDLMLRHKKGDYVTLWGNITGERINVRGRPEGIPVLNVDGVDLLERLDHVPTAEELGFRTKKKKPEDDGSFLY